MKKQKAISWEKLSEGTLTAADIEGTLNFRQPITMSLVNLNGTQTTSVDILVAKGPVYNILSQGLRVNPKPYKYLSCAVRRAVKSYKEILRTGKWRCLTKYPSI